jgi:ribosome-associated toxin RatA of RatAB toxin-antitoxin module
MFRLVEQVDQYPRFLPWCAAASVKPVPGGADPRQVEATIEIAYRGVRSRFTTRNENLFPDSIRLSLIEGPFRRLSGEWGFVRLGDDASKVTLLLQYQFAAGLLGKAIAPVFEFVANSMIDAFARRAEELYAGAGG